MCVRHMQLRELFLKQIVQQGFVEVVKIGTLDNPADVFTKVVNRQAVDKFWNLLGEQYREFEVNVVDAPTTDKANANTEATNGGGVNDFFWWVFPS